jgi:integrase/recombinase XerD
MKEQSYSVSPYWDSRAMDAKTKMSRIMLTVNIDSRQFRITLKLKSTKSEFAKAISSTRTLSDSAKSVRKELNDYLAKAEKILERLSNPSQETFTRLFKSETDLFSNNKTNVIPFFEQEAAKLFKEERFSTSSICKLALTSLLKYKPEINFEDIDEKFLKGYIARMISQGNSQTTAQIYLRSLRSIFNDVIKSGIISEKHYPFKGFAFGSKVKSKAVLYPEQLKALLNYETTGVRETRAKAFFLFCYLSNGMNFQDAALLKFKNITGDIITFIRHKTKNTTKSGAREIKVYLHDLSKEIIKEWGNKSTSPDDYVFPIVKRGMTAFQAQNTIRRYKRVSNKMLAKIGRDLGFEVHLCLNLARHSYATKMKIDGVSVAAISDALGHTTTTTTEHYMKSLPNEQLKLMSSSLLAFE